MDVSDVLTNIRLTLLKYFVVDWKEIRDVTQNLWMDEELNLSGKFIDSHADNSIENIQNILWKIPTPILQFLI